MENPATWGPAEEAVQAELNKHEKIMRDGAGLAGLSQARRITGALREAGLLAGSGMPQEDSRFLVAALGDDGAWTTPVRVRCTACQAFSPPLGGTDAADGNGVPTGEAPLRRLGAWAAAHECGPALEPGHWAAAGEQLRAVLGGLGLDVGLDTAVKAFASALQAVWAPVKDAARKQALAAMLASPGR